MSRAIGGKIAVAQIVGHNENNVRLFRRAARYTQQRGCQGSRKQDPSQGSSESREGRRVPPVRRRAGQAVVCGCVPICEHSQVQVSIPW